MCRTDLFLCAAANRNPIMAVANWTLGQPLASKPGEQYSYSDDAYALLSHIVERVRTHTGHVGAARAGTFADRRMLGRGCDGGS